jgi:hypothetical protein
MGLLIYDIQEKPFFGSHQIENNQGTVAILKYHFNRHILQAEGDVVAPSMQYN